MPGSVSSLVVSPKHLTVEGSVSGEVASVITVENGLPSPSSCSQLTVTLTDLGTLASKELPPVVSPPPVLISSVVVSEPVSVASTSAGTLKASSPVVSSVPVNPTPVEIAETWVDLVKGSSKPLSKKGVPFTLPSGELCVKIPNGVIERNKKAWDLFVLGQFYSDPPAQDLVHNIVNGIWSRQFRDISVSKMEGNSYLFRIPNSSTRSRVLNQRLWQIEGQTMFVAKWVPGIVPSKPELSSAPIWLELRNVPLQFFHEEGLERIASLVGHPKCLHPSTANKTNLEVAKVLTIIDPRQPLPEAVNVQFDSGEVRRILVSNPWMPPVCLHCKEIGHSLRHYKSTPITCKDCSSSSHSADACPKKQGLGVKKRRNHRSRQRSRTPAPIAIEAKSENTSQSSVGREWKIKVGSASGVDKGKQIAGLVESFSPSATLKDETGKLVLGHQSSSISTSVVSKTTKAVLSSGVVSKTTSFELPPGVVSSTTRAEGFSPPSSDVSEAAEDSSDVLSSDSEEESFTKVLSQRQQKLQRGKGLK